MPVKSYWFYLESYVYAAIKGNDLLLYNSLTGKILSYIDSPRLVEFLLDLSHKENLYVLKVSREFLRENGLEDFSADVSKHFMGDLIDVSLSPQKPFVMPPCFDIREEEKMAGSGVPPRRSIKNVTNESLLGLNELTFYVNSRCDNNCKACSTAYKQFPWCTREKEDCELSLTEIADILDQTKGCFIKNINIIGGDLTLYPGLDELVDVVGSGSFNVNFYFHLSHLKTGIPDAVRTGNPRIKVNVLIDGSALTDPAQAAFLKTLNPDSPAFLVQQEEEFSILEEVIAGLNAGNISVRPYFNGDNLEFFKGNVFTDYESLSESILEIEAIKRRSSHNPLYYGKMFIMSNKNIYSNLNGASLGKIGEISMTKAVVSELSEHGNWLRVRRDVVPCKDCLLDSICPPLSNLENFMGINNSCTIWKADKELKSNKT